ATVFLEGGRTMTADLVVGADGISSPMREQFLGRPDPPQLTGDLAYRLLLDTDVMRKDPDLRPFVEDPQVNYWVGPDKHAVNYVLAVGHTRYTNLPYTNLPHMNLLYMNFTPTFHESSFHESSLYEPS
ncbi:unnamed protein product, partial [Fusarium langsethiae]